MNILVTGGATGLGASITKKLAEEPGNYIYFTYNTSVEQAKIIEQDYKNTKAIQCNFLEASNLAKLVEELPQFDLDVLINNAFSTKITKKKFHKIDLQDFINGFEFNIVPTVKLTQQTISLFRKKKFGKIVTILTSSIINKPPVGYSEYAACKSYIFSLSKSWANENAGFNITSNCVSPSFMQTKLTNDTDERVIEGLISSHPLKKLLTTDEVADSVLFLVKSSQQINGINLLINSASDVI